MLETLDTRGYEMYAPPGQSLAFSLGDENGFEWIGACDITADELLAVTDTAKTESKTAQAEALDVYKRQEENCLTENVASLRSVKVATPPCAAKAAIP